MVRKKIDIGPSTQSILTATIARGPCPMMNTLANHGFLHRDGLNLTEDVVIKALQDGLNFDTSLSETMFKMALPANPDPNATWFTL